MSHIKKECRCLKKIIHQIDRKETVALFSKLYGKISIDFSLNTRKRFFFEVLF